MLLAEFDWSLHRSLVLSFLEWRLLLMSLVDEFSLHSKCRVFSYKGNLPKLRDELINWSISSNKKKKNWIISNCPHKCPVMIRLSLAWNYFWIWKFIDFDPLSTLSPAIQLSADRFHRKQSGVMIILMLSRFAVVILREEFRKSSHPPPASACLLAMVNFPFCLWLLCCFVYLG